MGITFKLFASVPMCVLVLVDIQQNLYLERNGEVTSPKLPLMQWSSG